jgi:hypothetical protein
MEVEDEQACKAGAGGWWVCGRLPDREWGPLSLAASYTGCLRTGLVRNVGSWRCIPLYRRIRRSGIDSHGIGRLLSAQEIPVAIVFYNLGPTELMLDVSAAGPGRLKR